MQTPSDRSQSLFPAQRASAGWRHLVLGLVAISVVLMSAPGSVLAQDFVRAWPAKPVMLILPLTPGSGVETEARLYTQKLSENLGKSFLLDFKPGGATTIATAHVAKASPDGYTLLATTASFSQAAVLQRDLSYDPIKDLTPLTMMSRWPSILVASTHLPVKSATEYIAHAKANPGKINFGSYGAGSGPHVGAIWLHSLVGTHVTYVHYKGTPPLQLDLIAGRIDAGTGTFTSFIPLHRAGKLRILSVSTPQRVQAYPEFPTLAESGVPGYDYGNWWALFGPGRMLPALANRISGEFVKAGKTPAVQKKMADDGFIMTMTTPEEFRKELIAEIARMRKIVVDNNIKAEE